MNNYILQRIRRLNLYRKLVLSFAIFAIVLLLVMVLTDELRRLILYNVGTSDYIKAVKYTDGNALDMTVINRVTSPPKETKEKLMEEFGEKQGGYAYYSPTEDYPYLVSGRYVSHIWRISSLLRRMKRHL